VTHNTPRASDADREWIDALSSRGPSYEQACERLHSTLLRVSLAEVRRRASRDRLQGPELDDIAHQAASDALMSITRRIGDFRGESRFTTWAFKFAVLEVSNKLGRHFRRTSGVALDNEEWERLPDRFGLDPAAQAQAGELLAELRFAVRTVLTAHQRRIFGALVLNGVPLDALVAELGTNRNAVYKTMFDARRKLRAHLVATGHLERETARTA
jgi:RNA polymerase sigma factor (sigma-70 family)